MDFFSHRQRNIRCRILIVLFFLFSLIFQLCPHSVQAALFKPGQLTTHGWVREYASFSLEDKPETIDDDQGKVIMLRSSVWIEPALNLSKWGHMEGVFRADREIMTGYLQDLELPSELVSNPGAADLEDFYGETEIRELFYAVQLSDNVELKIGRQLVAWGKTDFFKVMDIVHGFDNTWFSIFAPDHERRKPLWMANTFIGFGEYGSAQFIYMPGYDDGEDIGNSVDRVGGRWARNGSKGLNLAAAIPHNFNHPESDPDNERYGVRWFDRSWNNRVEWSLAYLHTFNPGDVVNSSLNPFKQSPIGPAGAGPLPPGVSAEFIYPEVDLVGATFNTWIHDLGLVLRGEASYTFDKPFTTDFAPAPGFQPVGGIIFKDTVKMALGIDYPSEHISTTYLGAWRPGSLTIQLFDEYIVDFEDSDRVMDGPAALRDEHKANLVALWRGHFLRDRINLTIPLAFGLTEGGGFAAPSIQFVQGDHWRISVQGMFFWDDVEREDGGFIAEHPPFDFLVNNNQLATVITYQF